MKIYTTIKEASFTAKSKASGKVVNFASQQNRDNAIKSGEYEETDGPAADTAPAKPKVNIFDKPKPETQPTSDKDSAEPKAPLKAAPVVKTPVDILKSKVEKWSDKEKAFFRDGIHKEDSPERRNWKDAIKDKAKGAIAAIKKGAKHEVEEFKAAGAGVKNFFSGKELSEHEKKALKAVAIKVATTAIFGAVTGGAGHGVLAFGKHVAMEFIPHVVGETILKGAGTAALFAGDEDEDAEMERFMQIIADKMASEKITPELMTQMVDSYNAKKGESVNESDLKGYLAADVVDDIIKSIGSKFVSGEIKNAPNRNYIYLKLTDIKFGSGVVKMLKSQFGIDAKIDKTFGNIPSVSFASNKVISEAVTKEKVYIDYLNKAKGFKQDRIKFNSYEEAVKWARKNFDKFSPDMIKYESINEEVRELTPDQSEMVQGIIDMLLQIKDTDNRMEVAQQQIQNFKDEEIVFNYAWFLSAAGLDNNDEPVRMDVKTQPQHIINKESIMIGKINEDFKHIIHVDTPTQVVSKPIAAQILALAKKGIRSKDIGLEMGFVGNAKLATDAFQKVKNKIYFELGNKNESVITEDTKRANILGIDFNISEMNGRIFFSFIDKKAASLKIREIGTNKIVNLIQKSLDNAYGKGEFFFKGGDHAEFQNGYLFQRNLTNVKLNKLKFESVNEVASRTAMEIGGLTGMNKDAIQKFVDEHNLNIEKVFQFVKKGKLPARMDFMTAVVGKPGNPIQKKIIKMLGESVNEGSHGMATKLLQSIVSGDSSRAEGTKMSKELAQHYIDWIRTSPFGKKNGNLPLDMLVKASFNWGIERGLDSKLKGELSKLKSTIKESVNEVKYPTNLYVGSVIYGQGFTGLKGIEGGKYYKVVEMDDTTATLVPCDQKGKITGSKKVRHKLSSIEGGIKTAKRGDENGIVIESINEEDTKSPEETLASLKQMAMGDLERIEDYAEMISDRMKEGQELSAWMYSQITLAVDQLNAVHDTMDGKDGVKESVNEEKPGLWANIRAKKARGGEPAHGNSDAHKDAVKAGEKIKNEVSTPGEQIQNLNNRLTKLRQDMAKAKSPEAKNVIQARMKNALQKLSDKKKDMGIKKP
jgi:hypothetical protein